MVLPSLSLKSWCSPSLGTDGSRDLCLSNIGELGPPLPEVGQHIEWNTRFGPGTSNVQNPLISRTTREHGISSIAYSRQVQDLSSEGQWVEVSRPYTLSHFSTMQAAV